MASQKYKDRLMRAVDGLPEEEAAKVVDLAESLCAQQAPHSPRPRRRLGFCRGQIRIDPSFFDPLPDDVLDAFEGRGK